MSVKRELKKLSKSELIKIILELREKLEKVEALLRQLENHNTPSSQKRFKSNTKRSRDPNKKRFPGRPKGHEGAGVKLPKPDRIVEHAIHKPGYKKVGQRVKTVIDFVEKPIIVTRHIVYRYRAPDGNIVEAETDLPNGIYGRNLQAVICLLKGKLGVSHESTADFIKAIRDDISLCAATSLSFTDRIAEALGPEREAILAAVRSHPYCNTDDTGLRQDGLNGYAWVFCNPKCVIYELDLSRSGKVPRRVLGPGYDNTLVCDGWAGYNGYRRQRCWPHLTRELDALAEDSEAAKVQADYFHRLYNKALEGKKKPPDERAALIRQIDSRAELGFMITVLARTKGCRKFATKLSNARPYLFTGVKHPEIPLDNNHAERVLRKIVVHRKLMGCIRNEKGQRFIQNVMSAIQTWHLQGKNPYQNLKNFTC